MALISLQEVGISFGGPPLLDSVSLQIQKGERICLLGRNGAGKTTLMKLIHGDLEPDHGVIIRQQGFKAAILTQEVIEDMSGNVFDVTLGGFEEHKGVLEIHGEWEVHRQVETVITRMKLDPKAIFRELSAGLKRRVLLARALVCEPDILLLDEPTNHLDIDSISWLEEFLLKYGGTLLFVTHDRMLVRKLSTRIIELDRGNLTNWECDYETFLERKDALLDAEQQQWDVFDKKMAKEEIWIRRGVKARRTRNEGRVNELMKMRQERLSRREQQGTVRMTLQESGRSGKMVIEAETVEFGFDEKPVVRDLNILVLRGDRVGIIGPNGCGKTTLIRVLLGELKPGEGKFRMGVNLEIAYFDQLRGQLDEERSVIDNIADGSDWIVVNGKSRHVIGYLQEFLFSPERSRTPVKVLSGGERNRLLLAKLFARPANLLVMDEPTNDLDIETLELLEEMLLNFSGTLLLVSHDRAFLNNVVTSTLVFEDEAQVTEYIGGYDDWLRQRPKEDVIDAPIKKAQTQPRPPSTRSRKLSNKEKIELDTLPQLIEALEEEQEKLYRQMADPDFYRKESAQVQSANKRLETLKKELAHSYKRWEELEGTASTGD